MSSVPPASRSLKVYVAAAFARGEEMRGIARDLERQGHRIVSSWIDEPTEIVASGLAAARSANRNLIQLKEADICLMFSTPEDSEERGRGGRHVELGAALAWHVPVVLIGPDEHLFHVLVAARYPSWAECRASLPHAAPRLAA